MKPGGSGVAACNGDNCIAIRKIVLGIQQLFLVELFKIQFTLTSIRYWASCNQYKEKILSRHLAMIKQNKMYWHHPLYTTRPRCKSQQCYSRPISNLFWSSLDLKPRRACIIRLEFLPSQLHHWISWGETDYPPCGILIGRAARLCVLKIPPPSPSVVASVASSSHAATQSFARRSGSERTRPWRGVCLRARDS